MNAKIKYSLLNYTPIGTTAQHNVKFIAQCKTTKNVFKSRLINEFPPPSKSSSQTLWQFHLFASQNDLLIQMLIFDPIKKTQHQISQSLLSNLFQFQNEVEIIFFKGKQRIGALTLGMHRPQSQLSNKNKIKNQELSSKQAIKTHEFKTLMKSKFQQEESDSENQRYDAQFTPHETINNSVVKLAKVQDHSYINIFKGLDESSIEEREPFSGDQSFLIPEGIQFRTNGPNQIESKSFLANKSQIRQKGKLNFLEPELMTSNSMVSKQNPSTKQKRKEPIKIKEQSQQKPKLSANLANSNQSPTQKYKIEKQPQSLQRWLKKLQKFQKQKQKQTTRGPRYECIVAQKPKQYKSRDIEKQSNVSLNLKRINLDSTVDDSYCLKSLKMKVIDEKYKIISAQDLFECKFSLIDESDQNKSRLIKLENLMTEIPHDANVEVQICLENLDESEAQEVKVSGIFMKDKLIEIDQIPLFDQDQNLFGSLSYKAKKIKSVSVQYLSPLHALTETQELQKSKIHRPSKNSNQAAKNLIRQRKINKLQRRQVLPDEESPQKIIDEYQRRLQTPKKLSKQKVLNQSARSKNKLNEQMRSQESLSPDNSEPNKRKYSAFSGHFERSNTDNGPYSKQENLPQEDVVERQSKSSRSPSIKEIKSKIMKINQEMSQFTGNVSLPVSHNKYHPNRLRLKSTTLADLREEQSEDQEDEVPRGANFQISEKSPSEAANQTPVFSPKKHSILKKMRTEPAISQSPHRPQIFQNRNSLGNFIIEINAITVILYEHTKPQETDSGKFIILKSESGETFITETLFSNHLNMNWKNKFYQFTSSNIEIGIYEKSSFSSQSQSKLMGSVDVKLVQLMKAIKQNFHRAEIIVDNKPIGIVILIYDIFLQKQFAMHIQQERRNNSEMKIINHSEKVTPLTNDFEDQKSHLRGSEKSTIKVGREKNRKRAKTLESNKKTYHLPVIDRISNPSRRRPYYYEGGKNITIGRAERFSNMNMAEIVGQL